MYFYFDIFIFLCLISCFFHPSAVASQPGLSDIKKQEIQANLKKPFNRRQTTEDYDNDLDDVHYQQGRIETKQGVEVSCKNVVVFEAEKAG